MAIYHLSVKPISRAAGRSSTASAAYRSASRIVDERTGEVWDFTKKQGVEHTEIVLPAGCSWQPSRSELWNSAELAERRKDACVAREHEVALPKELTGEQRLALIREYAADLSNRHGCAVDFAIHQPRDDAAPGAENWHAHVMCTTRKVDGAGLGQKCDREKVGRSRADLQFERQRWEEICNKHLTAAGIAEQVDCRSLVDQGIVDRPATTHDGPAVSAMKRSRRDSRREGDQRQHEEQEKAERRERKKQEVEQDARRTARLRERIRQEPNRIHAERRGRSVSYLRGLSREDRRNGRQVWRFPPQKGFSAGAVAVIDHGDSISLPKTSDARIRAAVALAKEKGWTSIVLTGDKPFLYAAARAAHVAGLRVENTEPELQAFMKTLEKPAQVVQQKPQPTATPLATPVGDLAGLSPAQLGDRLRQVEIQLERQNAALKHADSMGYASICNREKHLKTQLAQAKAKVFEDGPMLRGVFSSHTSLRFGQALETAQADRRKAAEEIAAINNTHTLGRLLSAGKRRDAERRLADAQHREQDAQRQIEQIEETSQAMKDPKMREAYRRWAIGRMKVHNGDIAKLEKLTAEAGEERAAIERKADFSPGEYRRLAEEKKRLETLGNALAGDPDGERRRREDEADTQQKLKKLSKQSQSMERNRPRPRGPGM